MKNTKRHGAQVARNHINSLVEEMTNTIVHAVMNYEIWWTYQSKDYKNRYFDIMERYDQFFTASIHAHFVALLVSLYRLYEKRNDSVNFYLLIERLEQGSFMTSLEIDGTSYP